MMDTLIASVKLNSIKQKYKTYHLFIHYPYTSISITLHINKSRFNKYNKSFIYPTLQYVNDQ